MNLLRTPLVAGAAILILVTGVPNNLLADDKAVGVTVISFYVDNCCGRDPAGQVVFRTTPKFEGSCSSDPSTDSWSIPMSHPQKDRLADVAMAAYLTGATVTVYGSGGSVADCDPSLAEWNQLRGIDMQ